MEAAFYRRTAEQHEQGKYHSTDEDDAEAPAGTGRPDPDPHGKNKGTGVPERNAFRPPDPCTAQTVWALQ